MELRIISILIENLVYFSFAIHETRRSSGSMPRDISLVRRLSHFAYSHDFLQAALSSHARDRISVAATVKCTMSPKSRLKMCCLLVFLTLRDERFSITSGVGCIYLLYRDEGVEEDSTELFYLASCINNAGRILL